MSEEFLIVETCRAGQTGHRFLLSSAAPEDDVALLVSTMKEGAPDGTIVARRTDVVQKLANGTTRIGTDTAILSGGSVGGWPRDAVQTELESLLRNMEPILDTVNWEAEKRPSVRITRLDEKLSAIRARYGHLANANDQALRPELRRRWRSPITVVKWLTVGLVVLGIVAVASQLVRSPEVRNPDKSSDPTDGNGKDKSNPPDKEDDKKKVIGKLAKKWGCKPEDVIASIHRTRSWDTYKRENVGPSGSITESEQQYVSKFQGSRPYPYLEFMAPAAPKHLRTGSETWDHKRAIDVRKKLHEMWTLFKAAREDGKALLEIYDQRKLLSRDGIDALRELESAAESVSGLGMDAEKFDEPKTPIFDKQDGLLLELDKGLREKGSIKKILGFGKQTIDEPDSDKHAIILQDEMAAVMRQLKSTQDSEDIVEKAYNKMADLCNALIELRELIPSADSRVGE